MQLVKIRDYNMEDWPAIEVMIRTNPNLQQIILEHEKKLINLYVQQHDFGKILVALEGSSNAIIGYEIIRYYRNSAIVESIVVDTRFQNKGVGGQLLEFAKKLGYLESPNIQVLRVAVPEDNNNAVKFFLNSNFVITGYIKSDHSWYNNNIHLAFPLIDTTF